MSYPDIATKPCGTHAAFNRHKARNETPCDTCKDAERTYQRHRMRAYRANLKTVTGQPPLMTPVPRLTIPTADRVKDYEIAAHLSIIGGLPLTYTSDGWRLTIPTADLFAIAPLADDDIIEAAS